MWIKQSGEGKRLKVGRGESGKELATLSFFAALTVMTLYTRQDTSLFPVLLIPIAAHELGHLLMMRLLHVRVRAFRLRLFDVLIEADEPATLRDDALITLGGPAVNLLLFAALFPLSRKLSLPHLALGVFNLLPALSLDGGHLLEIILLKKYNSRTVSIVLKLTTFLFLLPLLTAGVYLLLNSGYNYSLLAISLYLLTVLLLKK